MEEKIKLLMQTSGCNRYEAELAYKSSDGNFVEALDFLNRVSARLTVTRGKFRSAEKFVYGIFLIIADSRKNSILTASAVVTKNPAAHETDLSMPWEEIEKNIYSSRLGAGAVPELSGILQEKILAAASSDTGLSCSAETAKSLLASLLESEDVSVVMEMSEEPYKTPSAPVYDDSPPSRVPQVSRAAGGVVLAVEPLADEKSGARASSLGAGDVVWIKISDDREIAEYLAGRLGAAREGRFLPVAGEISEVRRRGDEVALEFCFAENVRGEALIPASLKIKKAERAEPAGRLAEWFRKLFAQVL